MQEKKIQNRESDVTPDNGFESLVESYMKETMASREIAEDVVRTKLELIEKSRQNIDLILKAHNAEKRATIAEQQARTDSLTGVPNNFAYRNRIDAEVNRSKRKNEPLSVIMIDIDHFKKVNDTLGHKTGDEVLKEVASILQKSLPRSTDMVARYGGEEFVVILPDTDSAGATIVAERLRKAVKNGTEGQTYPNITISLGCATLDRKHMHLGEADKLQVAADTALYHAKNDGRNRVTAYETDMKMPKRIEKILEKVTLLEHEFSILREELLKEERLLALVMEKKETDLIEFQKRKITTLEEKIQRIKTEMQRESLKVSSTNLKTVD